MFPSGEKRMPPRFVHVFVMTQAGSDETGMPSELPVQSLATRKPVSSKTIDVVAATDVPSRNAARYRYAWEVAHSSA